MWAMGFTHTGTEIHVILSETTATVVPKFHVNNLLLRINRCFIESSSTLIFDTGAGVKLHTPDRLAIQIRVQSKAATQIHYATPNVIQLQCQ
jgi:hypothetical protein